MDVIEYADYHSVAGIILLLDIEKAFDSVNHDFLLEVLKQFNFGNKFIQWIQSLYFCRNTYVINNDFMTKPISMERGILQGCPVSPYLFPLAIEILAIAIRQNDNIHGIPVDNHDLRVCLLDDDTTCFLDGSSASFDNLFDILNLPLSLVAKLIFLNVKLFGLVLKRGAVIVSFKRLVWFGSQPNLEPWVLISLWTLNCLI